MLEIDGSQGEGGGQILRTALSLSMMTGQPISIYNIRAGRTKPGLRAQHLEAVKAAGKICLAEVRGDFLGATELTFVPNKIRSGRYAFHIGTAGSTSLLLQTIFYPLGMSSGTSEVQITGGTHVPWSPCYHYLAEHWGAYMQELGFQFRMNLIKAGFYPRGGGEIFTRTKPVSAIHNLQLENRGALVRIRGLSCVANLDESIARRQKHQALRRLQGIHRDSKIQLIELPAGSPGTLLLIIAEFESSQCCYFALGERGKPAEKVADEAVDALERFLDTNATVDEYLADQILLPLCLSDEPSTFITPRVTKHLLTNSQIIKLFLPVKIDVTGEPGTEGIVHISPA